MSLITRCPACETLFKVVPDQLRISEGWVRCGQCDEVFDASVHLVKDVPPVPVPVQLAPTQDSEPFDEPFVQIAEVESPPVPPQFLDLDLDFSDLEVESTESPKLALDFDAAPEPLDLHPDLAEASDGLPLQLDLPESESKIEIEPVDVVLETDLSSPADVSFLRTQAAKSARHRPLVRGGMVVLTLVLSLTLGGQFVFHERDRLAAHEPRLTPWLLAVCAPLGCSLSPVQRIESVAIESSSFARIRGETYLLRLTLKNAARTPLAMPAIELTLTDALDQAVLRRVVLPQELGAPPNSTLDPSRSASLEATFLVKLDATSQRMAGYRLLAFYP